MAGPDRPPVLLAKTKVFLLTSICIPVIVLTREIASAPPASTALAISGILVTLGESFIITGLLVAALTTLVTDSASFGSVPKTIPPSFTLGHDIFTSNISIGWSSKSLAASAYSSRVFPTILTILTVLY